MYAVFGSVSRRRYNDSWSTDNFELVLYVCAGSVLLFLSTSIIHVLIFSVFATQYNAFSERARGGYWDTLGGKLAIGCIAGVLSAAAANPLDLIMVRTQAELAATPGSARVYDQGFSNSVRAIRRDLGVRGMFTTGCLPTITRAGIVTASEQVVYDVLKRFMIDSFAFADAPSTHLLASFAAGFSAAAVSCPIDVVKTHVMTTSAHDASTLGVSLRLLRQPTLLYRGFLPYYLKVGPWAMIMFVAFEQYKGACQWWSSK